MKNPSPVRAVESVLSPRTRSSSTPKTSRAWEHLPLPSALRRLLATFRAEVRTALGSNLDGLYLLGSVLSDDFQPASSDVDLLVITRRPLSRLEGMRVKRMHRRLARAGAWGRRLEGGYAARARLRSWGIMGRVPAVARGGVDLTAPNDWTAENMMALRQAAPLLGPPPASVFPVVSRESLDRALSRYLHSIVHHRPRSPGEAAAVALNTARCLYSLQTGRPSTKTEAGIWLGERLTEMEPVLKAALRVHRGQARAVDRRVLKTRLPLLQREAVRMRRLLRRGV